jgi:hypothetical protein
MDTEHSWREESEPRPKSSEKNIAQNHKSPNDEIRMVMLINTTEDW